MKKQTEKKRSRFFAWLAGPKSDFVLFAVLLVLLNVAGARAFLRLDLTAQSAYSLSPSSRLTVRSIEEPLSVKVFFTKNLPAPYNSVERYLRDLLVEYSIAGTKKFSYEFFDMEKGESQELARSYGVNQIQVQEVKDNEVGLKTAYMGLALVYADGVEVLDGITSTEGLEYKLTTKISKMISTVNTLSGLKDNVRLTLYASAELASFGIQGFDTLEKTVRDAYESVNKKSMGKIDFAVVKPSSSEVAPLAARYGLQTFNWTAGKGFSAGSGTLGIVLEYRDRARVVPLALSRNLFGGYGIAGLDKLSENISGGLQALMSKSAVIGYVTGHGEKDLNDQTKGSARLNTLVSGMYEFRQLALSTSDIPSDITSLVIDGPRAKFTDAELYKIDQFLMGGGNLLVFLDPFDEKLPENNMAYYGVQPTYTPVDTGLENLLSKYGVTPAKAYTLDKECYVARQQGTGDLPLYYVPLLSRESLNQKESVSKNLAFVLLLQAGPLDIDARAARAPGRKIVPLATSSAEAWRMSDNITLMPSATQVPAKDSMKRQNLVVLLEGSFDSAFPAAPAQAAGGTLDVRQYLSKSVQPGKIIVAGTSSITTQSVIDETGTEPVAVFVRNAIDYLNGNEDLIAMRTKGMEINTLNKTTESKRTVARIFNMYGLPALVAVVGLAAWRRRVTRRRRIEARYKEAQS